MQEKMQSMQEEMANREVEGQAGAGMVKVVMTGRHDVRSVTIDPAVMTEDKEVLGFISRCCKTTRCAALRS